MSHSHPFATKYFNANPCEWDFIFCLPFATLKPQSVLDRICLVLLLPVCFPTAFVRLPTSALPLHLAVARYAFDETSAHLPGNQTKSVQGSNDRLGLNVYRDSPSYLVCRFQMPSFATGRRTARRLVIIFLTAYRLFLLRFRSCLDIRIFFLRSRYRRNIIHVGFPIV